MANKKISATDIMAEEGLGLNAAQLETFNPDVGSARLTTHLATILMETERLSNANWIPKSSKKASALRELNRLTMETLEELSRNEEKNYRYSLIIGYLYGQLASEESSDPREYYTLAFENIKGLHESEEHNYRRIFNIGYQYGKLITPSSRNTKRGVIARISTMKADFKRSEGGKVTGKKKKSDADSRKAEAKRISNELIASGKEERGVAQLVANRMGVTAKTIREWRRSGWK